MTRSPLRRFFSVSYVDMFRTGPANLRLVLLLGACVGLFLALYVFIYCVTTCSFDSVRYETLPSGQRLAILDMELVDSKWVRYITNSDGSRAPLEEEALSLVRALEARALVGPDVVEVDMEPVHVGFRWRLYGRVAWFSCCTELFVELKREGLREWRAQ
jgi:hypothetical protein